jgi:hypothetical protein
MERFKQTIAKLENEVAELKQFQTKIQGSTQKKGDIHYCTGSHEFGEYTLDELDTFRFAVAGGAGVSGSSVKYAYRLLNPTPELTAYLKTQGKNDFSTEYIEVNPDKYEEYCMKMGGTPFVLTDEIRKCLDSKLWEFAKENRKGMPVSKEFRDTFYIDIPIRFEHTYKISPHVSFYITPLSNALDECLIHEITTNQVVFRVKYGNMYKSDEKYGQYKSEIYSGLKLHYSINGVIEQPNNLLD